MPFPKPPCEVTLLVGEKPIGFARARSFDLGASGLKFSPTIVLDQINSDSLSEVIQGQLTLHVHDAAGSLSFVGCQMSTMTGGIATYLAMDVFDDEGKSVLSA
jgi:hypothetical protein